MASASPRQADDRDAWDQHWQRFAASNPFNPAQEYRRQLLARLVRRNFGATGNGLRLVDFGSGTGELAQYLCESFPEADVLGLESSRSGVELAKRRVARARFLQRDLLRPRKLAATQSGWANAAICSEVLEHVDDPARLLANARAYLAPGALLFVTVPGGAMSQFDRHIGHRRHFDAHALRAIIEASGLRIVDVFRAGFPFFNLYRLTVIARGARLVQDVERAESSVLARIGAFTFGALFKLNLDSTPWGWQMVAVAVNDAP